MEKTLTMPSPQRCAAHSVLGSLIEEWIPKLAINAGAALDARTQAVLKSLWLEGLGDLSPDVLRAAFVKTLRECAFWPVKVADIRKHITHTQETASKVNAAAAWEKSLNWVRRWYRPDCRDSKYPELGEQSWRALSAAGGPAYVSDCSLDKLDWARKTFIEAYLSLERLKHDEHFIGAGEAKKILAALTDDESAVRVLPAPEKPQPAPISEPEQEALDGAAAREWEKFEKEIRAPRPAPAQIGEQEWNRKRDEQLARLRAHLAAHPELSSTAPDQQEVRENVE